MKLFLWLKSKGRCVELLQGFETPFIQGVTRGLLLVGLVLAFEV
jgi:hypothetical protein